MDTSTSRASSGSIGLPRSVASRWAAEHRSNVLVAAALMRAATEEMVTRGYTHVITDVFEDDTHSPLGFHTRVMGFIPSGCS